MADDQANYDPEMAIPAPAAAAAAAAPAPAPAPAAAAPAGKKQWRRFITSPLTSSTVSVIVAIGRALVQQFDATHSVFYWDRFLVLVGTVFSLCLTMYQFHKQLKENDITYGWPWRGWFLHYPRLPHEPRSQRRKRFYGHIMQLVGLIAGCLQVVSSLLSFVYLQSYGSNVSLKFSIVAFAYPIVSFIRNLFPEEIEPVYNVTLICGGVEHTCRASLKGYNLFAECNNQSHLREQGAATGNTAAPQEVELHEQFGGDGEGQEEMPNPVTGIPS